MSAVPSAVHRAIVWVDVAGFADPSRTGSDRQVVRQRLYDVLRRAFIRSGISWDGDECYHEDRGDGAFVLVAPDIPKSRLAVRLPRELVAALEDHNRSCAAGARIRRRAALHAGEVRFDANGADGRALIVAHRLLDSDALKSALRDSPGVLALVASQWFFEEVMCQDPAADPGAYPAGSGAGEGDQRHGVAVAARAWRTFPHRSPATGRVWCR